MSNQYHTPVMLTEAIEGLVVHHGGIYVDATYGGGGHSEAIIERIGEDGFLYAFDQDADAARQAMEMSAQSQSTNPGAQSTQTGHFCFIGENFAYMRNFLRMHGVRKIDGVLADLGVSSHQFDTAERGFSTRFDGELDMRMDRRREVSARDVINTYDEPSLAKILRLYGELPNAKQMARAIVKARNDEEIASTGDLKRAVERHLPRGMENRYLAMLFQALRIEVNGELEALKALLEQATEMLVEGGRLVVISYHSLEDRLVKNYMRAGNFEGEVEKDFYGNPLSPLRQLRSTAASDAEVATNNRARSARLRVAEKLQR